MRSDWWRSGFNTLLGAAGDDHRRDKTDHETNASAHEGKHNSLKKFSKFMFVHHPPHCRYIFVFPKANIPKITRQKQQNGDWLVNIRAPRRHSQDQRAGSISRRSQVSFLSQTNKGKNFSTSCSREITLSLSVLWPLCSCIHVGVLCLWLGGLCQEINAFTVHKVVTHCPQFLVQALSYPSSL